jgi:hypothetical protein
MPKPFYWPIIFFSLTITAAIAPLYTYGQLKTIQLDSVNIVSPKSKKLSVLTFEKQRHPFDSASASFSITQVLGYAYYKYTFPQENIAHDILFKHTKRKTTRDTLIVNLFSATPFSDSIALDSLRIICNKEIPIRPGTTKTLVKLQDIQIPTGEILFKISTRRKRGFQTAGASDGHFCSPNKNGKLVVWKNSKNFMYMPWFRFRYYTLP